MGLEMDYLGRLNVITRTFIKGREENPSEKGPAIPASVKSRRSSSPSHRSLKLFPDCIHWEKGTFWFFEGYWIP